MVVMTTITPAYSTQRQDSDDSDNDATCLQHSDDNDAHLQHAEARYGGDDNDATYLQTQRHNDDARAANIASCHTSVDIMYIYTSM